MAMLCTGATSPSWPRKAEFYQQANVFGTQNKGDVLNPVENYTGGVPRPIIMIRLVREEAAVRKNGKSGPLRKAAGQCVGESLRQRLDFIHAHVISSSMIVRHALGASVTVRTISRSFSCGSCN